MTYLLPGRFLSGDISSGGSQGVRLADANRTLEGLYLGTVGRCPLDPVFIIFIFDNSGSVTGSSGANDPCGNRFLEARHAIKTVGRRCRCGDELVALLNFDSPNSSDVPPTPIKNGQVTIEQGLAIPKDGAGSSVLGPALGKARALAGRYPNHQVVLCVLSDFELFDGDVPSVLEELSEFPGKSHAVVLRSAPPQQLLDDQHVAVTQVGYNDQPGTLAKAVFSALTANRRFSATSRKRS